MQYELQIKNVTRILKLHCSKTCSMSLVLFLLWVWSLQ